MGRICLGREGLISQCCNISLDCLGMWTARVSYTLGHGLSSLPYVFTTLYHTIRSFFTFPNSQGQSKPMRVPSSAPRIPRISTHTPYIAPMTLREAAFSLPFSYKTASCARPAIRAVILWNQLQNRIQ